MVLLPCITVCELGLAEVLKSGGPGTTSVTVAVRDRVLVAPVIVNVYVPAGVVDAVETVRAELPEVVIDAGLKLAVAPVGSPVTLRFTVSVKPFSAPIVAV
jgi:hypothetical protein